MEAISFLLLNIGIVVAAKDNWIESETFASCFASTSMHVMTEIVSTMVGSGYVTTRIDSSTSASIGSGEATYANVTIRAGGGSMFTVLVLKNFAYLSL